MTPLRARLLERIEREGPMTVADYMAACLWHPTLVSYATRDPLGRAGDSVTPPQVTPLVGQLTASWRARME